MESQTQPSTSNFFTMLPAEMRNMIYALAFTPGDCEMDKKTDLLKAVPPNREQLLVSRQTYIEAWVHYEKATKAYWAEGKFIISVDNEMPGSFVAHELEHMLPSGALEHIKNLTLVQHNNGWQHTFTKLDAPGIWRDDFDRTPCIEQHSLPRSLGNPFSYFLAVYRIRKRLDVMESASASTLEVAMELVKDPGTLQWQIAEILDRDIW
ncbi:hypothetical protein Slin15195_G087400 [Septoria linicola]|uniref:Uncharacterized protein n=1 Tax=Septoria linicola TaxID=215465 RepID=A0A9Q9B312_9PEZI|nr:hypothetical protein Slin14017_G089990 [Septoria linicola]USW55421.1 hypothetical protein Slin15195_G087400 [Septoria linicola]